MKKIKKTDAALATTTKKSKKGSPKPSAIPTKPANSKGSVSKPKTPVVPVPAATPKAPSTPTAPKTPSAPVAPKSPSVPASVPKAPS